MQFLQRKAFEMEQGAINEVAHAFNTLAPQVSHGPVTVPCHIIPEWHHGVVVVSSGANTAIYHCQSHWWALPLTTEQMNAFGGWQQFRGDEREIAIAQLQVGLFREDLGSIEGGAVALAYSVGESVTQLAAPSAPVEVESGLYDDDGLVTTDEFQTSAVARNWLEMHPQMWILDLALWAQPDGYAVVTSVPNGILLSFVGAWESAWTLVLLAHGEERDSGWDLILRQGFGDTATTDSRWPLALDEVSTVEVAAWTAGALEELVDEHAGSQRRALREAQLTWATVCHRIDDALEILIEVIDKVPHEGDRETLANATPNNIMGVAVYLDASPVISPAQRSQLVALLEEFKSRF